MKIRFLVELMHYFRARFKYNKWYLCHQNKFANTIKTVHRSSAIDTGFA